MMSQFWGEDMIVTSAALRDRRPGAALTYVEIVCLARSEVLSILPQWPASKHAVHIAATVDATSLGDAGSLTSMIWKPSS